MENISNGIIGTLNRSWRRRRYLRVSGGHKNTSKAITLGGRNRRFWKIKAIPRLRLKKPSPIRLWIKFKNAYIDMMLRLGRTEDTFGSKRVLRALKPGGYSMGDFHSRLIYEISKSLIASRELATI